MRLFSVLVTAGSVLLFGACAGGGESQAEISVQLTQNKDTLNIAVGGQPFAVYNFAKALPKPYFWPVRAPSGQIMTRPLEKPRDHKHHRGIWFSVDEVNGIEFWAERGKIENVSVEPLVTHGNPARFKVVNHWLGRDGQPVLIETTTIGVNANRVIAYDAVLTAGKNPVHFGDTKEGLFGFRMVNSMREPSGGKVENADGLHGSGACWGKTSQWVDYHGNVEGKTVGVAIFDNPHNFRASRYHVRDYGLFSISPFGEKAYTNGKYAAAPVDLKPGANLRLRYAIYIHDGDAKTADVAGAYSKYVAESGD